MPMFRPEIEALSPYRVGRPVEEVARDLGIDPATIVRLTANETPHGPFPGVRDAVIGALGGLSRYPDNDLWELSHALAAELGVDRSNLLFGNGSVALLADAAVALGGPGSVVVYAWPGFVMYRFAAIWAGSDYVEVPLGDDHALDLDAIEAALDERARMVVVCNPNNPTGTVLAADEVAAFARRVPDSVLVVVDEAYHEFVTDDKHATAIPLAIELGNVVVLRTFSKVYGLAAQRIGYAVGSADVISELRKAQPPMTVNSIAQVAALASLGQPGELRRRVEDNVSGRHHLLGVMRARAIPHARSETNFVYFQMPGGDSSAIADRFLRRGVIIRPMADGWMRVTVGLEPENERFVEALDSVSDKALECLDRGTGLISP